MQAVQAGKSAANQRVIQVSQKPPPLAIKQSETPE
jgi:hypothetical protein